MRLKLPLPAACLVLFGALALAACAPEANDVEDTAAVEAGAQAPPDAGSLPPAGADDFLAQLEVPFPHAVTNHRELPQKDGGTSHVYSIDYSEGTVRTIDQQLATALNAAGFERGARKQVPGGVRVAYSAADGRRVSTMIRNKEYFGDRIADGSAGQVSLSYVPL